MSYVKILESSQTWTCPHDGTYLITCVGGGAGGSLTSPVSIAAGETTSFGNYISAIGGNSNNCITGGYTPSDGVYGGVTSYTYSTTNNSATKNGITHSDSKIPAGGLKGIGYGAGTIMNSTSTLYIASSSGNLMTGTVELTKGTNVICTVGKGGIGVATTGADGVIVIKEV